MGIAGNRGVPIPLMVEANDGEPRVFHRFGQFGVSLLSIGKVMGRTIDVNSRLVSRIEEIRCRPAGFNVMLGVRRQAKILAVEIRQPASFEFGPRKIPQNYQMLRSRLATRSRFRSCPAHSRQDFLDLFSIQQSMHWLVGVVHEAVVARGLTLLGISCGSRSILTRVRVKVANFESLAGYLS